MNFVEPGLYVRSSLSYLFVVSILVGCAGVSTVRGAEASEACVLVSRDGDVVRAVSAKTKETLFENSDVKKVIDWAVNNADVTILEPGTYTVNEAVRISRSGTSLIIKENATLQMPPGFNSSYISEEGADYYPLVYVAPKDVFSKDCILENVNVINFNENIRIGTVIGSAPSEEILDINNSPNVTVERVVGYGDAKKMNLVGLTTYPRSSCMTLKKYIGNSASSVVVKRKDVVNKEVKQWERTVEVPPLPESLPRFAVKAKLIAVFEDGSREVVFDETIPLNLGGGE